MYYSMTFIPYTDTVGRLAQPPYDLDTDRNTWQHWRLVPTSRPVIAPPALKEHYVNVPGSNGKIDLVQALTGYPTYDNRTGQIDFAVMNDFRHWQEAYSDIMATIHGRRLLMVYEEDPEYYYVGRWSVSNWKTEKTRSTITLSYDLEPYKWRLFDAKGSWLWDPFDFRSGIIPTRDPMWYRTTYTVSDNEHYEDLFVATAFRGENVVDDIGEGHLYELSNITGIIGNAPVPLTLTTVNPDDGKQIQINFFNPELGIEKAITINSDIGERVIDDFLITNYSGVNDIRIQARGHGTVEWNFRPGRL